MAQDWRDEIDPTFRPKLIASEPSRQRARQIFDDAGWPYAYTPPLRLRPKGDTRFGVYSDAGDVHVGESAADYEIVEVKQRFGYWGQWTSRRTYPPGDVMVDQCHKVDIEHPRAHLIFNEAMTHICWVPADTAHAWRRVSRHDRSMAAGQKRDMYLVPKGLCWWFSVERAPEVLRCPTRV